MHKKTEAKCNGAMLTVGFHSASPPLIWRFDLERNHSFTLSLQGEEGDWELGITSPKGDFYTVAHFAAREDAEEAFIKVEKILAQRRGALSLIIKAVISLAIAAACVAGIVALYALYVSSHKGSHVVSTPILPTALAPAIPEGVPVSADDVLTPPKQ